MMKISFHPILYGLAFLLLIAALPVPSYGFYILVRFAACAGFVYLAVATTKSLGHRLSFGVLALLFNPLFPVHLGKELWVVVDIAAAIYIIVFGAFINRATDTSD